MAECGRKAAAATDEIARQQVAKCSRPPASVCASVGYTWDSLVGLCMYVDIKCP